MSTHPRTLVTYTPHPVRFKAMRNALIALFLLVGCDNDPGLDVIGAGTPCETRADAICNNLGACQGIAQGAYTECLEWEIGWCTTAPKQTTADEAIACADAMYESFSCTDTELPAECDLR